MAVGKREGGVSRRISGTVKWFDPRKGFGFVTSEDGSEAFVHESDLADAQVRVLREGEAVTFEIEVEEKGPHARQVRLAAGAAGYRFNQKLAVEEDREHEFKSLVKARDPVRTICDYYVAEYVNAFLNTRGGAVYFGVEDDGRVQGLPLDRAQRDRLRTRVSRILDKFQPAVEPELYELRFVPVVDRKETYVVEIRVRKGIAPLYMTGSQHFYLRRDSSNFLMPFDLIRRRLQGEAQPPPLARDAGPLAVLPPEAVQDLDLGILLAMVFMSWAGEPISAEESRILERRAQDAGLDPKDVAVLRQAAAQPPLLETVVAYLPTPEARRAAATVAYLVALSDNVLTLAELQAFDQMCTALGLSAEERQAIRTLGERRGTAR